MKTDAQIEKVPPGSLHPVVSPLFLYLKDCKIEESVLKKLESAGYLPIAVESFDAIKIVEPVPIGATNAITRAAMECLATTTWSATVEHFGRKVAKALAG
jgi:hypothetical protein